MTLRIRRSLAVLISVLASGCAGTAGLTPLREGLAESAPALRLERVVEFGIGPAAMFLLRSLVPGEYGTPGLQTLSGIDRIEIGVYEVASQVRMENVDGPLNRIAQKEGWSPLLRVREGDELTWALSPTGDRELKDIYMIVLDDEELVLMKLSGDIKSILKSLGPLE